MRVYTSSFKNAGYLRELGVVSVGVSRFPPKEFETNNLYLLAPSAEILAKYKGDENKEAFASAYKCLLRNTNIADMCHAIEEVSENNNGKDVALCCYEEADKFCHRHVLADFFNEFQLFSGNIHEYTAKDQYSNFKSNELF